eukprot:scaffold277154_cov31-Tisochrysis_lutea.AAC.4
MFGWLQVPPAGHFGRMPLPRKCTQIETFPRRLRKAEKRDRRSTKRKDTTIQEQAGRKYRQEKSQIRSKDVPPLQLRAEASNINTRRPRDGFPACASRHMPVHGSRVRQEEPLQLSSTGTPAWYVRAGACAEA